MFPASSDGFLQGSEPFFDVGFIVGIAVLEVRGQVDFLVSHRLHGL